MISVRVSHRVGELNLSVDFAAEGGVTSVFGRSGAGKTTLLKAIAGLMRPDEGRIEIAGQVVFDSAAGVCLRPEQRSIGYVFQDARLFPHLSVAGNLDYAARFRTPLPAPQRARIIELLGLGPLLGQASGTLSGGEASRVALGRAVLSAPRLLLLDEPLAALDEARKAEILPYLERLRDEAVVPMIHVSHAMSEVARLADRLLVMADGAALRFGALSELLSDPTMSSLIGPREMGSVLTARIGARSGDGLMRLDTGAGPIWLPEPPQMPGETLRLRLLAQDVMIALKRPEGISAINVLPAVIDRIHQGDGPGALLRLRVGTEWILSRVTRRSVEALGLTEGLEVHVVLKAVSVAPANVG